MSQTILPTSKITNNKHYYTTRVYYEDTDSAQVVYHGSYLNYMERARTEFLLINDIFLPDFVKQFSLQFLVRDIHIKYDKPATLCQIVTVVSSVKKIGKASFEFLQEIYLNPTNSIENLQDKLVSANIVIVCAKIANGISGSPQKIPLNILDKLKSIQDN